MSLPDSFNARSKGYLPGLLGIEFTTVSSKEIRAQISVTRELLAPNGFLHAASVVALADTSCGYGCEVNLPEGAVGFTTIELKSNHLGTARDGIVECIATPAHLGGTTQVWDAIVVHRQSGKTIAIFRCTQLVLKQK